MTRIILVAALFLSAFGASGCAVTVSDEGPEQADDTLPEGVAYEELEGDIVDDQYIESEVGKADIALPAHLDLLATQGPIRDQGRRNTCTAFAAVALAEHYEREANPNRAIDLSEQYVYWQAHGGDDSLVAFGPTLPGTALDALRVFGAPVESTWRYEARAWGAEHGCDGGAFFGEADCLTNGDAPTAASEGWKYYLGARRDVRRDVQEMKSFLATYRDPIVVGFVLDPVAWGTSAWRTGGIAVPRDRNVVTTALYAARFGVHVVLVVGWDDNAIVPVSNVDRTPTMDANHHRVVERGAFIIRNSWGTGWGTNHPNGAGYGYVSYNFAQRATVLAMSAFSPRL